MNYIEIIIGIFIGTIFSFLFLKYRLKELKTLRYKYLLSQESETKFVKDKILEIELEFHNFKYQVFEILNKDR